MTAGTEYHATYPTQAAFDADRGRAEASGYLVKSTEWDGATLMVVYESLADRNDGVYVNVAIVVLVVVFAAAFVLLVR